MAAKQGKVFLTGELTFPTSLFAVRTPLRQFVWRRPHWILAEFNGYGCAGHVSHSRRRAYFPATVGQDGPCLIPADAGSGELVEPVFIPQSACCPPKGAPMPAPWSWPSVYSFRSRHPGGTQFVMADSSIRFVRASIDLNIYRAVATKRGGEAVQLPN
jgi:hypothetical protein